MGLSEQVLRAKRERGRAGGSMAPAVMRGTVAAVENGRVWVTLPSLSGQELHGPVTVTHGMKLLVDDRVVVASVGGQWSDLIVIAADTTLLGRIQAPTQQWMAASSENAAAITHAWDPNYGWVAWIDLEELAVLGDVLFTYPFRAGTATSARPYGWRMTVRTSKVSGVTGLRPRVDYMAGASVTGANAQLSLAAWPDWAYAIEHDFILPAGNTARPTFLALGVESSAVGRVGLTAPLLATKSERSQ